MPGAEIVQLPSGRSATLVSIGNETSGDLIWLHVKRTHYAKNVASMETSYNSMVGLKYRHILTYNVLELKVDYDAVIKAPSSQMDAAPYFNDIQSKLNINDRSNQFSKKAGFKAAESSPEEVFKAMAFEARGDEYKLNSILIVDESFATGATVDAIVRRLIEAGAPKNLQVHIAVALHIRNK